MAVTPPSQAQHGITAGSIQAYFKRNYDTIFKAVDGLSHEDSFIQPQPAGNCFNWVLGHIVATRGYALDLLGEPAVWSEDDASRYRTGSAAITDSSQGKPLTELLEAVTSSQTQLITALQNVAEDVLARPCESPGDDATVAEFLTTLAWHESYHVGQLAMQRRFAGLPGLMP
ncbi:MAG: DinB family protein [Deinococcota bacterium]